MPSRYAQWMYDWEHRLTSVDNNRVVRPLDWGVEWARDWPCRMAAVRARQWMIPRSSSSISTGASSLRAMSFIPIRRPTDFRLEKREVQVFSTREVPDPKLEAKVKGTFGEFLRFTAPVKTPYPKTIW
jgi:hypothetical protein